MWPSTWAARAALVAASLAVVAAVGGGAAWAMAQRPPTLYRIGLVAPFEGLYRETGYAALSSTRQEVAALNAHLAGSGAQFQVWAVDDSSDPAMAVRRAAELVADPLVLLVIGHFTPETTAAAAPLYADGGLTVVSPVALSEEQAAVGSIISLSPSPSALREAVSAWASEDAAGQRLAATMPLLDLEAALVTGAARPSAVVLPYTYCPDALVAVQPRVQFFSAASAGTGGDVAGISTAAAHLAGSVLEQAAIEGDLTRAGVAAAGANQLEQAGWTQSGAAWYDPTLEVSIVSCEN